MRELVAHVRQGVNLPSQRERQYFGNYLLPMLSELSYQQRRAPCIFTLHNLSRWTAALCVL